MASHDTRNLLTKKIIYTLVGILIAFSFLFGYKEIFRRFTSGEAAGISSETTAAVTSPALLYTSSCTQTPTPASTQVPTQVPALIPTPVPIPDETQISVSEPIAEATVSPVPQAAMEGPSEVVYRGDINRAEIAFTFDDSGEDLAKILEILNQKGVSGTFFLMAGELKKNPDLWRQAAADGHQICNHTANHPLNLQNLSDDTIKQEILGWEEAAAEVLGEEYVINMKSEFPYFRSPGGHKSDRLQQILGELGYTKTVYWSCEDCYFVNHNPENLSLTQHYINEAENGAIFLLHPGDWNCVADVIDGAQAKGYSFVTLSQILI